MSDQEEISKELAAQKQRMDTLKKFVTNYSKDGKSIKNKVEYFEKRLQRLQDWWVSFDKANHELIETGKNEKDEYFTDNHFEKAKTGYQDIRSKIQQDMVDFKQQTEKNAATGSGVSGNATPIKQCAKTTTKEIEFVDLLADDDDENESVDGDNADNDFQEELPPTVAVMLYQKKELFDIFKMLNRNETVSQGVANAQLDQLKIIWSEFRATYRQVKVSTEKKWCDGISFNEIQQKFVTLCGKLNDTKNNSMQNANVKLPKVKLPEFDCASDNWREFKSMFDKMVHENDSIPEAIKVQYLKSCLKGEAAKKVSHLTPEESNYQDVYSILERQYGNKRENVGKLIEKILDIPCQSAETSNGLKNLFDTANECLMAIKNYNVNIKDWDPLIIHILKKKLHKSTVIDYESKLNDVRELQTLSSFLQYVEHRFMALLSAENSGQKSLEKTEKYEKKSKKVYETPFGCTYYDLANYDHLQNLLYADPTVNDDGEIDLLLGVAEFSKIVKHGLIKGAEDSPIAMNSELGWLIMGPQNVDGIESEDNEPEMSEEERYCEEHYVKNTKRDDDGRLNVSMAFKNEKWPELGDSRKSALATLFQLEKRFEKNQELKKQYSAVVKESIESGHLVLVENPPNEAHYIPHHAVFKESTTTKLRSVYNASQKTSNGKSLNEQLAVGKIVQPSIFELMLRWRESKIAIVADLEKMYKQIRLNEKQQHLQMILWRNSGTERIKSYKMTTVTFGLKNSSFLAIRSLHEIAKIIENKYPRAAKAIMKCFYVDDYTGGAESVEEALCTHREMKKAFDEFGFNLRKLVSNSTELLKCVPGCDKEEQNKSFVKALGIPWKPETDEFIFQITVNLKSKPETKRQLSSEIASLQYDPLGWIAPVIVKAKILFQDVWQLKKENKKSYDWDDKLPIEIIDRWMLFKSRLSALSSIKMQRWLGVILTLPEYRLSFQLKIYETVKKGDINTAREFLAAHKWINANVRSILDESDAILHAKYQLIYTVGSQFSIDGGSKRWVVTQALLKRVPFHMKRLYHEHGEEKLEFNIDYVENGHVYGAPKVDYRDDVFTPCRILNQSIYPLLKEALIDDFLDGRMNITFPEVSASTKKGLRVLMSATVIDEQTFQSAFKDLSVADRKTILILSGLLRFEVLKLVLTKRWRVSYGVNENGTRKMAIPFKAKDVAAEMTEFGHPDVAICLTQLSYYYSGLSDEQMFQAFRILAKTQNAAAVYEKWITSITPKLIEPSIESYSGLNLSDPFQREEILFPLFRFNMDIIDFYLSHVVFPREAKSFENKLISTAWDLCSEHMQHRVTGFSGTNDTKNILPMPIAQNDLAELEDTNERVRQTLLQPENQDYQNLPPNVSARAIIEKLVNFEIPVLLDSGALMLELNNKQVAEEWLKMASDSFFDAAVYFDSQDVLQTVDRNDVVAEFDCSVYRENLNRCLVYLDDTHTRGTDLKFPLGWKACVTLSGEITRDKTVQACMRMRQLGKGHSIAFWASFEADLRIRDTCNLSLHDCVNNEHVIDFICNNSRRFEVENTVHWASAAYNYTKKLAAHKLYDDSTDDAAIRNLYEKCVDNEYLTLEEMYGDKEEVELSDISKRKFATLTNQYEEDTGINQFVQRIDDGVFEKLQKQAPDVKRFVHSLDEEQEKELEQEIEEERQIERPPKLDPANPTFDQQLISLMVSGATGEIFSEIKRTQTLVPFATGLMHTKLFEKYKNQPNWADHLYVTKDFVRVLANITHLCDQFLRPVWWIARVDAQNDGHILVVLSSFECDRLLVTFRKSTKSILFPFRPTLSKLHSDLLDQQDLRVTAKPSTAALDVNDVAQLKMYSGSMYFKSEAEQSAYCNFLGLIPRPRTPEQEMAFEEGIIKPNGFVPVENRQRSKAVVECVNQCRFHENPVDLAIQLIEAHHEFMRNESHASSVLQLGSKLSITK
ncbi:uncharacterized protein LOC129570781 [Sitodiplosis mosellana]|uniref:uncharacterized protein LOC129570781 n=1 Tax=Sitodiplosis mosellana TaxID=263140 RepID=UPI002444AD91|nr:uncharacterized protein LOC129570781 [Sitodiplosis mosellana]